MVSSVVLLVGGCLSCMPGFSLLLCNFVNRAKSDVQVRFMPI